MDRTRPHPPLARSVAFLLGSAADAVIAPLAALRPSSRVAASALSAAGLSTSGAYRLDVLHAARRRLLRRFRRRLRRRGPRDLDGALRVEGLEAVREALAARRGAIVLSTHGGPPEAVAAALLASGLDPLEVREVRPPAWDPPLRSVAIEDAPDGGARAASRAGALVACLAELKRGGLVVLTLEGHGRRALRTATGAAIGDVRVPAAGGAATLARHAGAPAFPTVARVSPAGLLHVVVDAPIALDGASVPAFDAAFASRAHDAFERLLADDRVARLERLRWALRIASWHAGAAPTPRVEATS